MKRILYLSITHKYILPGFFGLLLVVKFILEKISIPVSVQSNVESASDFLYWIYAAAMVNLMIFLLAALIIGNRNGMETWWEKQTPAQKKQNAILAIWIKTMVFTIPVALYGSFIYAIMESDWRSVAVFAIMFAIIYFVNTYKRKSEKSS